ncbi:ABC-F family ATP-binding cassette domain-containing protein [Kiritimatiellota bacterium B12222]|nr:ABC-F family ATP-binding cassette domain-containing protein [Kiritimatiellota bacterium B12222]
MIIFDKVSKQFGPQTILNQASFTVNPGEQVGIVGPNGAGKSTIFKLIIGDEDTDKGDVIVPGTQRVGYLRQQLPSNEEDGSLLDFVKAGCQEIIDMEIELHELQEQLTADSPPELLQKIGDLQHEFEHRDGYQLTANTEAALGGLGFTPDRFTEPMSSFSGGWQMRAQLARVLLSSPDILLLDEPSNYLDLPAVEWLQRFLSHFSGTLLLISHDRQLLRSLAKDILDLRHGSVTRFAGGYDKYVILRKERIEQQIARYKTLSKQREDIESFIRRFRAQATKAAQVQSRIKMLEKMEPLPDLEKEDNRVLLRLPEPPSSGHQLLRTENVGFKYPDGPWLFKGVDLSIERGDKLALVGYNGMGKTTLLKILAEILQPVEGKRVSGHHLVTGYQSQEFAETLPLEHSVFKVVKDAARGQTTDQAVRTLLGSFGFQGEFCDKPVKVLSGGEKIRLAFARIFINPPNLLLLDEPTTHLDIQGREALEQAICQYKGTVCFVSHDSSFVRNTANGVISIGSEGVRRWLGGYDDFLSQSGGKVAIDGKAPDANAASSKPKPDGKKRKEARKEIRKLENRQRKLEQAIEQLEATQTSEVQKAQTGEVSDFKTHQQHLAEIAGEIQSTSREWMEVSEEIERLEENL